MAEPTIHFLVKQTRERAHLTHRQLAGRLGCAHSHLIQIEREVLRSGTGDGGKHSKAKKGLLPSAELIRRIAQVCARNKEEEQVLVQRLLLARSREVVPLEIRPFVSEQVLLPMGERFRTRVLADVAASGRGSLHDVGVRLGVGERLGLVLSGVGRLSALEVAELARQLDQSVEEYLLMADYVSERAGRLFAQYPGCISLLEMLVQLKPETKQEIEQFRVAMEKLSQKTTSPVAAA